MKQAMRDGFTGRHMLFAMTAFFGVVISVNLGLAYFARSSWTGLVVENSYVASQEFNAKMARTRAQDALGWRSTLRIVDDVVRFDLRDAGGAEIPLASVDATFRRPVDDREDHTVSLAFDPGAGFTARHHLADGVWLVELDAAAAGLDFPYTETLRLNVAGGTAR